MARTMAWSTARGPVAGILCIALAGCDQPVPQASVATIPVEWVAVAPGGGAGLGVTGTVRLKRETPLAFTSAGRIAAIEVREGDLVRAGQALARLDTGPVDAAAAAAAAEVMRAEADLKRQRTLLAQGWVSRARVDQAQAAARGAAATRSAAAFAQRFARLTAPAGGIVLRRLAEPGQTMAAGTPVLVLGDYASGHVLRVPLTDAQVAGIRLNQQATVRFANGLPPMAARVTEIAGRADERTGTFLVDLRLPANAALRSGLVGTALFAAAPGGSTVLRVPASALFAVRADEGFVYVVTGDRIAARMVGIGAVGDGGVEVTRGLRAGEHVVRAGLDRLRDGARVSVAPERAR